MLAASAIAHSRSAPNAFGTRGLTSVRSSHLLNVNLISFLFAEGYMFQCTLCPLSFTRHSALKEHRKTHTVQKRVRQSKVESIASIVQPELSIQQSEPLMLDTVMKNVSEAVASVELAPVIFNQSAEPMILENMIKKQPI